MLTADEVRRELRYDPETGQFWRLTGGIRWQGKLAGTVHVRGRNYVRVNNKKYLAHRLAWLYVHGKWPNGYLDHKNGDPLDNRIENLRECTPKTNCYNRRRFVTNRSGFKGVVYKGPRLKLRPWVANININGKQTYLGVFATAEEAHAAYCAAAREHFGEFARTE